ncbi:MAG: tetratricopeptide (TPR) repeat protein, partial [Pirellulaceae bacterium]
MKYSMTNHRPITIDGRESRNDLQRIDAIHSITNCNVTNRSAWGVLLLLLIGLATTANASPLDDQIAAFKKPNATQTEATATQILKTGIAEHRSAEGMAAVQAWLNRNHLQSPDALFYAAQSAEFSGQWQTAVGLYQRLLQAKNVNSNVAGVAVDSTYRLLLNSIGDNNAAYLFMRKEGNLIRPFGRAKRFDRWFLDQAIKRRDLIAMCDRLAVIANDRATNQTQFTQDFEWLCSQFEQFKKETPDDHAAAMRLVAANAPTVIKARLKWVATVMPYNQNLDQLRDDNAPADPKLSDAPLAAAAELMKLDPNRGPFFVAQGWGVEYDHHHSGNCEKRFKIEGERKLAQLLAVLSRMSADKRGDLLAFKIAQDRVKFEPAAIRKALIQFPGMLNSLDAADVPLFDKTITVEEAKALAPQLVRNPHAQAAMVRAWARPDRKYSTVSDYMMQSEMWRFNDVEALTHGLWHSGMFERDVEHDAPIKKYADLDSRYQQLKKQLDTTANNKDRIAAFNALLADLLSDSPRIPGALPLWEELFTNAPNADKIQMLTKLTTDLHSGVMNNTQASARHNYLRYLLTRAVAKSRFGKQNSYAILRMVPNIHDHTHHNWSRYGVNDLRTSLPEFAAKLDALLRQQLKANKLSGPMLSMWMHCVDPTNEEATALMDLLKTSAAYERLDVAFGAMAAHSGLFGALALNAKHNATDPRFVNRELLELPKEATPAQVEAAFKTVMARVSKAPTPVAVLGLQQVADLPQWSAATRVLVLSLFKENAPIGEYPTRQGYEALVIRIANETQETKQWGPLEPYADGLWQAAATKDHPQSRGAIALSLMTQAALDDDAASIAVTLCRTALNGPVGRKIFLQRDWGIPDIKARVVAASGKAALAIGVIDIPVDELDPTYPLYKSQAEFALGNVGAAWDLYDKNAELLTGSTDEPLIRKMTPGYCLWLLERNIEDRDTERAEALVKELMIWSRREIGSFTPQQEAELKIAYADTAFQKGNYQTARAWYRRVADAAEHQKTELQYKSALRSVMVDRVSRNFGNAIAELDKLMLIRDDSLRTRAHFARAEVFYDQEKYVDAYEEVTAVLKRDLNHADGLILLGKAQLEMRKLVDASEIELGATRDQGVIVPGEMIKINLNDPSLNVAGVGADIEVEIWAESGDRERVMLHQLGDDKSKYRAEIPTKLAAPQPGDKTLQVLGRDKIRYGYSKEFRAKMADLPPDPQIVIGVASNARLDLSAGAFPARSGERRLDLSELGISTAQQALGTRNVRPGNPIYLRVFDPDQSVTDKVDEIVVSLTTSSGDIISQLRLVETGTHSGEFEAVVPTGTAQALAYASESSPGSDPNMVISAQPYSGWSGAVGSKASDRSLGIDLNDNVPLDKMTVHCTDATLAPTHFILQTSMNGRDWNTRARFPENIAPWDGRPRITSFPTYGRAIRVAAPEDRELPKEWKQAMEIGSARADIPFNAVIVPSLGDLNLELASGGHPQYSTMICYRALFYQPAAAIRTFQLTGFPADKNASTIFLLDGQPANEEDDDPLTIQRELRPGLHEIQVWRNESRSELLKRKPQLLCDRSESTEITAADAPLVPCPDNMFDPATFPAAVRESILQPAIVDANEDNTEFGIAFAANTQARVVRMVIVGHEGAAPAIHKITLTDRDGKQRLPVETDYQQLRNNQQLEVIPGDQISVRYEDTTVIAKAGSNGRTTARYEGRLGVAFNTATISASFLNYELNDEGERRLVLEDIRRFKMDDAVAVVITDADMDISPDRDQIEFNITAVGQKESVRQFIALETEPHSGVFLGRVFPVSTTPSRASEIQVAEGGTLTAVYRDTENLDPGIPTDRSVTIEHARYATPALAIYNATTEVLQSAQPSDGEKPADEKPDENENGPEIILPRRVLNYARATIKSKPPQALIGANLRFDVIAPHLAFAGTSTINAYVQTERALKQSGHTFNSPFDVRVPGTLKLKGWVSASTRKTESQFAAGYIDGTPARAPTNTPPLDEGRFSFSVPLILGDVPSRSYAT